MKKDFRAHAGSWDSEPWSRSCHFKGWQKTNTVEEDKSWRDTQWVAAHASQAWSPEHGPRTHKKSQMLDNWSKPKALWKAERRTGRSLLTSAHLVADSVKSSISKEKGRENPTYSEITHYTSFHSPHTYIHALRHMHVNIHAHTHCQHLVCWGPWVRVSRKSGHRGCRVWTTA